MDKRMRRLTAATVAAGMLVTTGACAHVKRDELALELSRLEGDLRAGYQAGDQELAGRVDGVDRRVSGLDGDVNALRADVASIEATTARLESDLIALASEFQTTVERIDNALAFNVPVHFGYDSARLRTEDTGVLDRFASVLGDRYPDSLVTVEGFTDAAGSAEYNQQLGQSRADAVLEYLAEKGLERERLRSVSYGEDSRRLVVPTAYGPGDAGLINRRVTLVVETTIPTWETETVPTTSTENEAAVTTTPEAGATAVSGSDGGEQPLQR